MIATQSPMILYEDSDGLLGQISTDNVQARRVENEDPLRRLESFLFSEGSPLIFERIEVSSFPIEMMGNLFMMKGEESLGLFKLKFSLFCFEGKCKRTAPELELVIW